jgi:hypothetical protein
MPKTFIDNKGVTKSSYPIYNAPERMEVPIKTIQLPLPEKRERSTTAPKDKLQVSIRGNRGQDPPNQ